MGKNFLRWLWVDFPDQIMENGKYVMIWVWRYFSIGYFFPRLLDPWHRDLTPYGMGLDIEAWLKAMSWNLISRFIGALIRLFCILFGLSLEIFVAAVVVVVFIAWYLLPILFIYLIIGF